MKCQVCGKGPVEGVSLFRVNAKGQPFVGRCRAHLGASAPVDPEVEAIVNAIDPKRPTPDARGGAEA